MVKDHVGNTLKANYKGTLYTVGVLNTLEGRVQIALPISEDSKEAYVAKVVKIKDVEFVLEHI